MVGFAAWFQPSLSNLVSSLANEHPVLDISQCGLLNHGDECWDGSKHPHLQDRMVATLTIGYMGIHSLTPSFKVSFICPLPI